MKTTWEYSLDLEVLRIIEIAYGMENGFFRTKNFPVVPYGTKNNDSRTIIFPDLPYNKIKRFWRRVRAIDFDRMPVTTDQALVNEVKALFERFNFPSPDYAVTKQHWAKHQDTILTAVESVIPNTRRLINSLTIYPTLFGSNVSFFIPKRFPSQIRLYLREDTDLYGLLEGVLSALTRHQLMTQLDASWEETELVVDWLLNYSSINRTLRQCQNRTHFSPTMKVIRFQQRGQLLKLSENFYRKLGLTMHSTGFRVDQGKIYYGNRMVIGLSEREGRVMTKLIELHGKVLSFDGFADLVFSREEEFSMYVLAKMIQGLREKLEMNQVPSRLLQNVRKSGYCLLTIPDHGPDIG